MSAYGVPVNLQKAKEITSLEEMFDTEVLQNHQENIKEVLINMSKSIKKNYSFFFLGNSRSRKV